MTGLGRVTPQPPGCSLAIYLSAACFLLSFVAWKRVVFFSRVIYLVSVFFQVVCLKNLFLPSLGHSSAPVSPFASFLEKRNSFVCTFNSLLSLGFVAFHGEGSAGVAPPGPSRTVPSSTAG